MSQELQTILLSLITSLIISLITFILGLKSGKNQTIHEDTAFCWTYRRGHGIMPMNYGIFSLWEN